MRKRLNLSPTEGGEHIDRLSARELETVMLASEGKTDRQISQELGIALGTLNTYWTRIRSKTGLHMRSDIVRALIQHAGRGEAAVIESEKQLLIAERQQFENLAAALVCLAEELEYPFAVTNGIGHIVFENSAFVGLREERGADSILERLHVADGQLLNEAGLVISEKCEVIYSAAHPDGYRSVRIKMDPVVVPPDGEA